MALAPSKWAKRYEAPQQGEGLVMFLEDGPYATYGQHWPDWITKGKRNFVCLTPDCPLCDVGDKPSQVACFNVLDLGGDEPILTSFQVGITVCQAIMSYADDPKQGLANRYYAVSTSGQRQQKRINVRPVKQRDLEEDFQFTALTDDEVEAFADKLWDESSVDETSRRDLVEIADRAVE
jgi:hypothetical protein